MMTDPISDMLTRIRNGLAARHEFVEMPGSKLKLEIARILKAEGYVSAFKMVQDDKQGIIRIYLKYDKDNRGVIEEINKVSKPGRRVYANADSIPVIKNGLGVAILTTSKGIMTDKKARAEHVGGEVLCAVW